MLKINFLEPVWKTTLKAHAIVIKKGSSIGLIDCSIFDENESLVAKSKFNMHDFTRNQCQKQIVKLSLTLLEEGFIIQRRVVITGYGAISPLGNNVETLWSNIKTAKSRSKKIKFSGYEEIITKIGGCIDDFKPEEYFDKKELGNYDLFVQYDMRQPNKR